MLGKKGNTEQSENLATWAAHVFSVVSTHSTPTVAQNPKSMVLSIEVYIDLEVFDSNYALYLRL